MDLWLADVTPSRLSKLPNSRNNPKHMTSVLAVTNIPENIMSMNTSIPLITDQDNGDTREDLGEIPPHSRRDEDGHRWCLRAKLINKSEKPQVQNIIEARQYNVSGRCGERLHESTVTEFKVFSTHVTPTLENILSVFSSSIHMQRARASLYRLLHSWKTEKLLPVQTTLFYCFH